MTSEFKPVFSSLEDNFDKSTIDLCWSCSRPRDELSFLSRDAQSVGPTLTMHGVANYIHKHGKRFNKVCPDFVILTQEELDFVNSLLTRASTIGDWREPFRMFKPSRRWAIELFGDYWHSEDVIGLPRDEHVRQVQNAYASIGWQVDIIWESDVNTGVIPESCSGIVGSGSRSVAIPEEHCKYFFDPLAFGSLTDGKRQEVTQGVFKAFRSAGASLLYPSSFEATVDIQRALKRVSDGVSDVGGRSEVGQKACKHFMRTLVKASPYGGSSLWNRWNDDEYLKETISRQLTIYGKNNKKKQSVQRVVNELLHTQGYRRPSNFPPLLAASVYQSMGLGKGCSVIDVCAGYGGRMFGAWLLEIDYVGIDANAELVGELNSFAKFLNEVEQRCNIEIYHGATEDASTRELVLGRQFDGCFTSPPYFDLEVYSEDKEQVTRRYESWDEFRDCFLLGVLGFLSSCVKRDAAVAFNVPERCHGVLFADEMKHLAVNNGWAVDSENPIHLQGRRGGVDEVLLCVSRRPSLMAKSEIPGFGIKNAEKNYYLPSLEEGKHYVECGLCGGRFARLSQHLTKTHRMSKADYLSQFPGSLTQAEVDSDRVRSENTRKGTGRKYKPRVAYVLPDGSVVRRKGAWIRAWGTETPPPEAKVDASTVDLDKWVGKQEGRDYVECVVCGYKAKNLTRHVRRDHNINTYKGELKSEYCKEALSSGAKKVWDKRGRKPKKVREPKKSDSLTPEIFRDLYEVQCLSDAKIGDLYDMTGEAIAYRRKRCGIETRKRGAAKVIDGMVTIPDASEKQGIAERTLREWASELDVIVVDAIQYYDSEDIDRVIKIKTAPKKSDGLTPEVLRDLYENQGFKDKQIGEMFGLKEKAINMRRKKNGIANRYKRTKTPTHHTPRAS